MLITFASNRYDLFELLFHIVQIVIYFFNLIYLVNSILWNFYWKSFLLSSSCHFIFFVLLFFLRTVFFDGNAIILYLNCRYIFWSDSLFCSNYPTLFKLSFHFLNSHYYAWTGILVSFYGCSSFCLNCPFCLKCFMVVFNFAGTVALFYLKNYFFSKLSIFWSYTFILFELSYFVKTVHIFFKNVISFCLNSHYILFEPLFYSVWTEILFCSYCQNILFIMSSVLTVILLFKL